MALKAPEGTFDLLPEQCAYWDHFRQACASGVFSALRLQPIETPLFEQTDCSCVASARQPMWFLKKCSPRFTGDNLEKPLGGESLKAMSRFRLRPEGTASVVRAVAQHDMVPQGGAPAKLMYAGPMFRAESLQKGGSANSARWASNAWARKIQL